MFLCAIILIFFVHYSGLNSRRNLSSSRPTLHRKIRVGATVKFS